MIVMNAKKSSILLVMIIPSMIIHRELLLAKLETLKIETPKKLTRNYLEKNWVHFSWIFAPKAVKMKGYFLQIDVARFARKMNRLKWFWATNWKLNSSCQAYMQNFCIIACSFFNPSDFELLSIIVALLL